MHSDELFRFVAMRAPRQLRQPIDILTLGEITPFVRNLLNDLRADAPRELVLTNVDDFLQESDAQFRGEQSPLISQFVDFHDTVLRDRPASGSDAIQIFERIFAQSLARVRARSEYGETLAFLRDTIVALKVRSQVWPGRLARHASALRAMDLARMLAVESGDVSGATIRTALKAPLVLPAEFDAFRFREGPLSIADVPEKTDHSAEVLRLATFERTLTELSGATGGLERRGGENGEDVRLSLPSAATMGLSNNVRTLLEDEGVNLERQDFSVVLDHVVIQRNALVTSLQADANADLDDEDEGRVTFAGMILPQTTGAPAQSLNLEFLDPSTMPPTTVGPLRPTGVGSLLKVRQQIKRYEAVGISHVQNVMRSESRDRSTRRLRRTEETFLIEEENTSEEERNLQTTERFDLKSEMERTVANSREFSVGATVSAGYGPFVQVEASTAFGTSNSTEEVERSASSYARELTEQTASKVAQRRRTQRATTTLEEFEENNSHGFDNSNGDAHAIGVYQWLEQVYDMQVYDYGVRMMFDFTVLEPAAMYLNALESQIAKPQGLRAPKRFKHRPDQLNESNYTKFVSRYRAEGVQPPPALLLTLAHSFSHSSPDGTLTDHSADAMLVVPEGYRAYRAQAAIMINEMSDILPPDFGEDGDTEPAFNPPNENRVDILIARNRLFKVQNGDGVFEDQIDTFSHAEGDLPISLNAVDIRTFAATVTIDCIRTTRAIERWQLATHEALTRAYTARRAEYEERLAIIAASQGIQPDTRNPAFNRIIERNEIRRLALTMLTGQRFKSTSVPLSPQAAEFDFDRMLRSGRYAQFWESAIEWSNLDFEFLPYYWARQSTWGRLLTESADPIHAEFIRAGAVRIRMAAAPGFEAAVLHFLETGEIWSGGELPEVTTPDYQGFLDEIALRRDADENSPEPFAPLGGGRPTEVPWGESWEVRLPTTLVRLRPDDTLPGWEQLEDGTWLPIN